MVFAHLLTNTLTGSSLDPPPVSLETASVSLSSLTHRLLLDLVLHPEPCTLLIQPPSHSAPDTPPPPLPLPLTYSSAKFHPSLPLANHSHLVALPGSLSLSHLASLCLPQPPNTEKTKVTIATNNTQPPFSATGGPTQAPPTSLAAYMQQMEGYENKPVILQEAKRALKLASSSKTPRVSFSLSPSSQRLSPRTKIAELPLAVAVTHPVVSLTYHTSPNHQPVATPPHSPTPPSLLEAFASCGGLSLVSLCLPSLYPSFWPHPPHPHDSSLISQSFSLPTPSPSHTLTLHSLVVLGLCLRLRCYGNALVKHLSLARTLLSVLLGAESKEEQANNDELMAFAPYLVLLRLLREHSVTDEVGVACREGVMEGGVVQQLLSSLAGLGHRPRATPTTQDSSSSQQAVPRPKHGMEPGHRLYWAKGTGFGTGSTTSTWNVDAMRARQKSEEKQVCLVFAILQECLARPEGCGQGEEPECGPALTDLLADSCLLPAIATYLVNDSILDIAKHTELYLSALGVLYNLTLHPSLHTLLTLPIFPSSTDTVAAPSDSSGLTLLSLSKKLRNTVELYSKTTRLKAKTGRSSKAMHTSGLRPLPLSVPPWRARVRVSLSPSPVREEEEEETKEQSPEAELAELTSAMLATAERVIAAVSQAGGEKAEGEGEGDGVSQETSSADDKYIETMRQLQFDTYQFIEEDDSGRVSVLAPFHYENQLRPSVSAAYGPGRARRLTQEVSALATSLPLSSSSSVFVRCDENRLDVMKVLITGPSDTPYANGCFEFDVLFPETYPQSPMLVNLMTTGHRTVRFNPNLYNDGKVCLSVLNTWHGRPEEKWNSETSSFLQVLVSIQSLVMVPDPYFNEPGYEQYRGTLHGEHRSLMYNANLYLATIQWAMIHQLQHPAPCFREVILKHFHLRSGEILAQCRSWVRSLTEGVRKMQAKGMATANISTSLHKLVKVIESLRTELGKVERKLSAPGKKTNPGLGASGGDSGDTLEAVESDTTKQQSSESCLASSDGTVADHPELSKSDPNTDSKPDTAAAPQIIGTVLSATAIATLPTNCPSSIVAGATVANGNPPAAREGVSTSTSATPTQTQLAASDKEDISEQQTTTD